VLAKQITSRYMQLFRWLMSIQYLYHRRPSVNFDQVMFLSPKCLYTRPAVW